MSELIIIIFINFLRANMLWNSFAGTQGILTKASNFACNSAVNNLCLDFRFWYCLVLSLCIQSLLQNLKHWPKLYTKIIYTHSSYHWICQMMNDFDRCHIVWRALCNSKYLIFYKTNCGFILSMPPLHNTVFIKLDWILFVTAVS